MQKTDAQSNQETCMLSRAATLALAAVFATAAHAEYPDKPIKIIVPYPPGGSTDVMTRIIGQKLQDQLKQPVIVENRGGASGIIGSEVVAKSAPDGYTLLMTGSGPHTINVSLFPKLPYHPTKDFTPVILTSILPLLMVAPASQPGDIKEFIKWAQDNKDKGNYCSIGPATPSHLAGELFKTMAKVDLTHIPYKGSAPALVDVAAGTCNVMFDSALSSGPQVKSGKLKLLGVATKERLKSWPNAPTLAESGLPNYEAYSWTALLAPAGTPKPVIDRLQNEVAKILKMPDITSKLAAQGAEPGGGTSEELAAFTETEIRKWGKVIKDGNIKID
jgi:tripartite-type tricarboxylate transporter receptor subunit TctC